MSVTAETFEFQTEARQLLDLMIRVVDQDVPAGQKLKKSA